MRRARAKEKFKRRVRGSEITMEYFRVRTVVDPHTGCWLWQAALRDTGYGQMKWRGKVSKAHRVAYQVYHGVTIASSDVVMHECDQPKCVNPHHLRLGTLSDNSADKVAKGRQARGEMMPRSKLTESQIIYIRKDNRRLQEIADDYDVCVPLISMIKNNRIWKHVLN